MEIVEILKVIGTCLFSYLMGSIPFGYIVGMTKGINIQKVGSGKTGGTNVLRSLGGWYGALVVGLDVWKGAMPIIFVMYILRGPWWLVGLALLFCFLGHVFPVWLKFKGGAGISVLVGGLLVILGWKVWLIIVGALLIVFLFFVKRRASVANLIFASSVLFLALILPVLLALLPVLAIIVGLIWWAHRENIQRLREKREPSVKLPSFFDKFPDDVIGLTSEKAISLAIDKLQLLVVKLQLFITKLQNLQKKP